MGLLNLFKNNKKQKSNLISIDGSLGNVLMCGNSRYGKERIISNYVIDALNGGGGLIVIRSVGGGYSAVPGITTQNAMIYDMDTGDGAFTEQFNPLAYLNDSQTAEFLFSVLNKYSQFESSMKMKFKQYISKMLYLIKLAGKTPKINELSSYTIETLEDINSRAHIPDAEKNLNERFFDGVRGDVAVIESYLYDFANNNVGFILSGDSSLEQIVSRGKIIEVSLDFSTRKEESELLLSILFDKLYKFDYSKAGINQLVVVLDELPNETLIKAGAEKMFMNAAPCHIVLSVMDIAMLAEKSNVFIDKPDSLFFFQQQSNKNQEYCSEFFGNYEKTKVSTTQTSGTNTSRTRSSLWDYWNDRGTSNKTRGTSSSVSYTSTTEKERVYLPDVFKNLPENQCIYFFRKDKSHNYLNI